MLCVISKSPINDIGMHSIQTNSLWAENPYEDFAIVPEDMVESIMETRGFCDIVLNEEGTEVVSFTAREIPVIEEPETEYEPSDSEVLDTLLGVE